MQVQSGPSRGGRRAAAAGAAAIALAAALPATAERALQFDVFLDDRAIGSHRFLIRDDADGRELIESDARFEVKLLGLVVYRYSHMAREEWSAGCLQRMDARTDDNGRPLVVSGRATAGLFELSQPQPASAAAACVSGYAYWNPARLQEQTQLLNPQTGRFDAVSVTLVGEEWLQRQGSAVAARRYRLQSPDLTVHLWYSAAGDWLQLESPARGGRTLRYQLRE